MCKNGENVISCSEYSGLVTKFHLGLSRFIQVQFLLPPPLVTSLIVPVTEFPRITI